MSVDNGAMDSKKVLSPDETSNIFGVYNTPDGDSREILLTPAGVPISPWFWKKFVPDQKIWAAHIVLDVDDKPWIGLGCRAHRDEVGFLEENGIELPEEIPQLHLRIIDRKAVGISCNYGFWSGFLSIGESVLSSVPEEYRGANFKVSGEGWYKELNKDVICLDFTYHHAAEYPSACEVENGYTQISMSDFEAMIKKGKY